MKDQPVTFSTNTIHYSGNKKAVVMDAASKTLMEYYSYIVCQNQGRVLDIGFGMGFSANKMYELSDEYWCIEINPQIYDKAIEWAKDKPNVTILKGDWIEVIPTLNIKFNGIFMDTHDDLNYNKFETYAKKIAQEGCILAIHNYFTQRDSNTMNEYVFRLDRDKFSIPVKDSHKVNWTVFKNSDFVKTSNKITFPEPTHIL